MPPIPVTRTEVRFLPDPRRVITKPFVPGGAQRVEAILSRILALPEAVVSSTLARTYETFSSRHADLSALLDGRFGQVRDRVRDPESLSTDRRRLIGAYFTHEFSIDAAALSNPSIVAAPNQDGLVSGQVRFVMSLRAIGEGHVSSIQFRSGIVDQRGQVTVDASSPSVTTARRRSPLYDKIVFARKLTEIESFSESGPARVRSFAGRASRSVLWSKRSPKSCPNSGNDDGVVQYDPHHPLGGLFQLRECVRSEFFDLVARAVSRRADGESRHGGRTLRSLPVRRREHRLPCDLYRVRRLSNRCRS